MSLEQKSQPELIPSCEVAWEPVKAIESNTMGVWRYGIYLLVFNFIFHERRNFGYFINTNEQSK